MAIEAILSDIGGVTIENSDIAPIVQERVGLTKIRFDDIWNTVISRYGSGQISELELWEAFEQAGGNHVSLEEDVLGTALAENLVMREQTQRVIRAAGARGLQLAALSDTNLNHARVLDTAGVYRDFSAGIYLSHETGVRKPAVRAYEIPIRSLSLRFGVTPDEILYVDDKAGNLNPAKDLGMQTLLAEGTDEDVAASLEATLSNQ